AEALADLQQRVRSTPGDAKLRTFLFQLLAVTGQWDRALAQLDMAGQLDPGALPVVQMYRDAIQAEAPGAGRVPGRRPPGGFGEPERGGARRLEALKCAGEGREPQAAALRAQALEQAPALSGRVVTAATPASGDEPPAGDPFEWIADADSRLGPMIEAV